MRLRKLTALLLGACGSSEGRLGIRNLGTFGTENSGLDVAGAVSSTASGLGTNGADATQEGDSLINRGGNDLAADVGADGTPADTTLGGDAEGGDSLAGSGGEGEGGGGEDEGDGTDGEGEGVDENPEEPVVKYTEEFSLGPLDGICSFKYEEERKEKVVDVDIAESYGDEKKRTRIENELESKFGDAYETEGVAAAAVAIADYPFISGWSWPLGIMQIVEKDEEGKDDTDIVWRTDKVNAEAKTYGWHKLKVEKDGQCDGIVIGTALARVLTKTEVYDSLKQTEEAVKELEDSVEDVHEDAADLLKKLKDLANDAYDEMSDSFDATIEVDVEGLKHIKVSGDNPSEAHAEAHTTVTYERSGVGDDHKDTIDGGKPELGRALASDTSETEVISSLVMASSKASGSAEGHGWIKGTLESIYASTLVAVCRCERQIWTDSRSIVGYSTAKKQTDADATENDGLKESIDDAINEVLDKVEKEREPNREVPDKEKIKDRKSDIESALKEWVKGIKGGRFENDPNDPE